MLQSRKEKIFPPFIPDNPEKPHLSCKKKEKERQLIIRGIITEMLKYNSGDWTAEKI